MILTNRVLINDRYLMAISITNSAYSAWIRHGDFPEENSVIPELLPAQYFIGVIDNNPHSSCIAGVMNTKTSICLARLGKAPYGINKGDFYRLFFCGKTKSAIGREPLLLNNEFAYTIYQISPIQFSQFIDFMKEISSVEGEAYLRSQHIEQLKRQIKPDIKTTEPGCYTPSDNGSYIYKFFSTLRRESHPHEHIQKVNLKDLIRRKDIAERAGYLNKDSSCRTTSADIVNYITDSPEAIPTDYSIELSFKGKLTKGSLLSMCVIPSPPPIKNENIHNLVKSIFETLLISLSKSELGRARYAFFQTLYFDIKSIESRVHITIKTLLLDFETNHSNVMSFFTYNQKTISPRDLFHIIYRLVDEQSTQ